MNAWQCLQCERVEFGKLRPGGCSCGSIVFERAMPTAARATELGDLALERVATGEPELDRLLLGGIVRGARVLVYGGEGSGKSRLCARWAERFGAVLYVELEMAGELLVYSARRAGARAGDDFHVLDDPESMTKDAQILRARAVVLDSLGEHPDPSRALAELLSLQKLGVTTFAIAHRTDKGKPGGGMRVRHAPDYSLSVAPLKVGARVTVRKSRFSPTGSAAVGALDVTDRAPARTESASRRRAPHLRAVPRSE